MKKQKILALLIIFTAVALSVFAEKLTVVYTGDTYSSLYPCSSCPSYVGGGIARRASVIKNLRKSLSNLLVVDAGNFTAGGVLDTESINANIDKKRTLYYINAISAIGYDAMGIGEAEFNFGVDFLKRTIRSKGLPLISCNVSLKGVSPYIIKEFSGFKVGVVGITSASVLRKNSLSFRNYKKALKDLLSDIEDKVDFIILLSSMPDGVNEDIARSFNRISFIISCGASLSTYQKKKEVNGVVILKPSYQAKSLNILELEIENKHIKKYFLKKESLSLGVKEDPAVKKVFPKCFSSKDCSHKDSLVSQCENPATLRARCIYVEAKELNIKVITDRNCPFCVTTFTEEYIKKLFAGAHFEMIDYRSKEAQSLIKKYRINSLPVFIIPKTIKEDSSFSRISGFLIDEGDCFLTNKSLSGIFLFINRERLPRSIDIFIDIYDPNVFDNFKTIVDFCQHNRVKLNTHFIYPQSKGNSLKKSAAIEEIKRMLAIKYLYPEKFASYLLKRFEDIKSSWWVNIMDELGIDYRKVKEAIDSGEIDKVINDDYDFSRTLGIATGGFVMLVNNRYIFRVYKIENEVLEDIIKYD